MFHEFEAVLKKKNSESTTAPVNEPKLEEVIDSKCWIVRNLLTINESKAFIEAGRRELEFDYLAGNYRHCYRSKFDDPELLAWLFAQNPYSKATGISLV